MKEDLLTETEVQDLLEVLAFQGGYKDPCHTEVENLILKLDVLRGDEGEPWYGYDVMIRRIREDD